MASPTNSADRMALPANSVNSMMLPESIPFTSLDLSHAEIELLRHHQEATASTGSLSHTGSTNRASIQALILNSTSLAALGTRFDLLMQQIQQRLEFLSEQSARVAQQQYDKAGNAIAIEDAEISRFHEVIRQIDKLEVDFDRIRHLRDIVRYYRQHHQQEMEPELQRSATSSRHRHRNSRGHHTTTRIANTFPSAQPTYQLSARRNAATSSASSASSESPRSMNEAPIRGKTRMNKGSQMHNSRINFTANVAIVGDSSSIKSESTQTSSSKAPVLELPSPSFNGQQGTLRSALGTTQGLSGAARGNSIDEAREEHVKILNATKSDLQTIALGEQQLKSLLSVSPTMTDDTGSRFQRGNESAPVPLGPTETIDFKPLKEELDKNEDSALEEPVLTELTHTEFVSNTAKELAHERTNINVNKEIVTPNARESHQRLPFSVMAFINTFTSITHFLQRREPPLPNDTARVRWQCICGQQLYDDFIELREGAAQELADSLNDSGANRTNSSNDARLQSLTLAGVFSSSFRGLKNRFGQRDTILPQHELGVLPEGQGSTTVSTPPQAQIYLLLCYSRGIYTTRLLQVDIGMLHSDKKLFAALRAEYTAIRGKWTAALTFRTLTSIKFVKFELHENALVDIRKEDEVPPLERVGPEYDYLPAPPETIPPVGTNYLLHIFRHPDHAGNKVVCFNRFPKKLFKKLNVSDETGIGVGWGLQFNEGWDQKKTWIVAFVVFLGGSLVFAISWVIREDNIQDAFAIANYIMTATALSIGFTQAMMGGFS